MIRVVPFHEELLPATLTLCAHGLQRIASRISQSLPIDPSTPAKAQAETMLRSYLNESNHHAAWAVLEGDTVHAFAGAAATTLTPDDDRYTYMPPRFVTVGTSAIHTSSDSLVGAYYSLLLQEVQRFATTNGKAHLFVNAISGDTVAEAAWRRLGLQPSTVMAHRRVESWKPSMNPARGVLVRVAAETDIEALADLALEEHLYHARHTRSGVSPDQPRATSRRVAAESITAPTDENHQVIAEDESGRIVGSIVGSIQTLPDDEFQRYLLPARYGYIGLTSVTAAMRGRGVGRLLLDTLMQWFAQRGISTVFLHFVADNPLSSRFWARAGFAPHINIYTTR